MYRIFLNFVLNIRYKCLSEFLFLLANQKSKINLRAFVVIKEAGGT